VLFFPGAEFTLYNTNTDGSIGSPRAVRIAGVDGKIRIYGLQPGTYILRETNPPPGYISLPRDFVIVVGSDYITTIDGQPMSLQDPIDVVNYIIVQDAGSLTIGKIVAGNGGNPSKQFAFTITFENAPETYPYIGDGVPSGTISSGDTIYLAHDQNITILNLPSGATYTVVEADYSADGYITTYTGNIGTIVGGEAQVAEFTNTREIGSLTISKTVAGNGGDPQKQFAFTVTFVNAPYEYPYVGSGGAGDGTIESGDTIYLGHGQSITINDLPKDATYTVVEADYSADGYITTYTGDSGTIVVDQTQIAAFTNTREIGSLTISKTVAGNGGDPQKQFAFTVTFVNAPYEYPYVGSGGAPDGTIESGDTIYLSHGQSITINDLPKDATYTVVEADYSADGYITTYTGDTGTIVVDQTQIAAFSKTVAGNGGDPQKQFAFTVTFVNAPYEYPYVGSGGAPDGTIESGDTIYLSHGQSITITGLPKDATYTVVEADYSADGYITTYTGDSGTIVVDQTQIAAFTNTREIGSLTISKTVAGNGGDPAKIFTFTITFEGAPYTYPYVGSGGVADGTITSGDTINLTHGQSITINDLPKDATYTVVEADYSADGYIAIYTGDTGTIVVDETVVAAFTNIREIGTLSISKSVTGNGGDPQKLFAFTVTFENAPYIYPYIGYGGASNGTITSGDTIFLAHGQSITIHDLPKDAVYTVVEADYSAEGYITTYSGDTGTIVVDDARVALFTNTREIGSLTIRKTVAGNGGDLTKAFAFTVTFVNAPYTYPYVGSGGAADGIITSGDTIYLRHGQSITIHDLPKDAAYTVVEADYSSDGYITTYTGNTGTIVVDDTRLAAFTNTRQLGSLTIKKTVAGDLADQNRYFTFMVEFETNEVYHYHGSKTGSIRSGQSVLLKHGEYIIIEDILVGTTYKVTELEANQGGYSTSYTGAVGSIDLQGVIAAFVNRRSSIPQTGDDGVARMGEIGLMISAPLFLVLSGLYGFLQTKKRKQPLK
jgi:ribosomal protein L2